MDKELKYVLSYGGGVNSSALYFYIVHIKKLPLDLVIFADTGEESPETMKTIKKMKLQCEKDKIRFEIVKSHYGRLVDYYTKNKTIPSMMKRDCTGKFKISPIRKKYKEIYDRKKIQIIQYIGIAYDEIKRVTTSNVKYIDYSYPFVDDKITRQGNIDILNKFKFQASKSGCMGCMFQSKDKWRQLIKEHRNEFERWKAMEENNRHYNRQSNPLYLNGDYSLKQIENFEKYQKTLDNWTKENDDDLNCPNTHGGCFL